MPYHTIEIAVVCFRESALKTTHFYCRKIDLIITQFKIKDQMNRFKNINLNPKHYEIQSFDTGNIILVHYLL